MDEAAGGEDDTDAIGTVLLTYIKAIPAGARKYLVSSMVIAAAPG